MDIEDNTETIAKASVPSKMSCAGCRRLMGKVDELQESVVKLFTKLNKMETKNAQYHTAIVGTLEELKVFSNQLMKKEASASGVDSYFPLKCEEDIMQVEALICDENKNLYVAALSKLWRNNVAKNLKNVLDQNFIQEFNIPGTHGRKRLLSFPKVYEVILDSILNLPSTKAHDPEHLLRNAWQTFKRNNFKSTSKIAESNKSILDDD